MWHSIHQLNQKKVLVGHLIYIGDKIRIIGEVPQDTRRWWDAFCSGWPKFASILLLSMFYIFRIQHLKHCFSKRLHCPSCWYGFWEVQFSLQIASGNHYSLKRLFFACWYFFLIFCSSLRETVPCKGQLFAELLSYQKCEWSGLPPKGNSEACGTAKWMPQSFSHHLTLALSPSWLCALCIWSRGTSNGAWWVGTFLGGRNVQLFCQMQRAFCSAHPLHPWGQSTAGKKEPELLDRQQKSKWPEMVRWRRIIVRED